MDDAANTCDVTALCKTDVATSSNKCKCCLHIYEYSLDHFKRSLNTLKNIPEL